MLDLLKALCSLDATSGNESAVRNFIISQIDGHCQYTVDPLGNLIAFKKGKNSSVKKLMLDAHTDEVGLIITDITRDGFLKFKTVGGIDTAVLLSRRVVISGEITGVIGGKPIHLASDSESKKLPKAKNLYIDIGARDRDEAMEYVCPGDRAVLESEFLVMGNKVRYKAIDDRIGCAILIKLIQEESDYDFYASFSVQEEVGLRGAKTAAYAIDPDAALVLEATTAADIADVEENHTVCNLGKGAAISFMDNATLYDRGYYNAAIKSGIACQTKRAVAGGNDSGAIHLSRCGVRTLAISVPCRYIHSASCVADKNDFESAYNLAKYMMNGICCGSIQ